jgi:hypothetical protein
MTDDRDVSYLAEFYSLVRQMAAGRFATQPEVNRAMISLRSYVIRVRRDFEMDAGVRRMLNEHLQIPVGSLSPAEFRAVGEAAEPRVREFLVRTGDAQLLSMFRSSP